MKFRQSISALAAIGALALTLSACGGGGGGTTSLPQTSGNPNSGYNPAPYNGPASLAINYGAPMMSKLQYVGNASVPAMHVNVQVAMQNAQGLLAYAQSASDPKSPLYRKFLTPDQIANQFGATQSDYTAATAYLQSFGLVVGTWPQRLSLSVTGTQAQMQAAFGTAFGTFTYQGKYVVAPTQAPHLTRVAPITGVFGLIALQAAKPLFIRGTGLYNGLSPQQISSAADFSGARYGVGFGGYTGKGVSVGIIGTGPIMAADTAGFAAHFNTQVASITTIMAQPQPASAQNGGTGTGAVDPYPGGLSPTAPPVTAPCAQPTASPSGLVPPNYNVCNPEDVEAQLDTQSIAGLAPGSNELFYFAYNPSICVILSTGAFAPVQSTPCPAGSSAYPQIGIQLSDDEIQQAIADNRADVLSLSYGLPENIAQAFGLIQGPATGGAPGYEQVEFASLAAEGIAVFVSSGDNGAWDCQDPATGNYLGTPCVSYPASDPNVVAVGGANIQVDESGNLTGPMTAWADNTTAGGSGTFSNDVGSGGGISVAFAPPAWQLALAPGATGRELPDVSLDADPLTGPSIGYNLAFPGQGGFSPIGGTSAAAPETAAQWGVVLSACAANPSCATSPGPKPYRLGNPAAIYYGIAASPAGYAGTFYDIITGSNQATAPGTGGQPAGYNAGPGYDMVTGIGVPFTGHLIDAIIPGQRVP